MYCEVFDLLDLVNSPDKACNIAVIPQKENYVIINGSVIGGSDMRGR